MALRKVKAIVTEECSYSFEVELDDEEVDFDDASALAAAVDEAWCDEEDINEHLIAVDERHVLIQGEPQLVADLEVAG